MPVLLAASLVATMAVIAGGRSTPSATAQSDGGSTAELVLVGHEDFDFIDGPLGNTDVWAHNGFAYVGTRGNAVGCVTGTGVKIVDVSDPENPAFVNNIPKLDTQVNDVKVIGADTFLFRGDILGHSNEGACPGSTADSTGIELYDVSDPLIPVHLSSIRPLDSLQGFPLGVHNLYLFQRAEELFALLVTEGLFDNFQIWDITDPRRPVSRGTWGAEQICDPTVAVCTDPTSIIETWLLRGPGTSTNRFLHDVWASEDGNTAYLSNWDAGMVILDISSVDRPMFVGATPFAGPDDEGNSHAAVPARGGRLVIETSEDFENQRLAVTVVDGPLSGSVVGGLEDVAGPPPPRFADVGIIGPVEAVFVGRGCDTDSFSFGDVPGIVDPLLNDPIGKVAVIRSGACSFAGKLARAEAAGAVAVLIASSPPRTAPIGSATFQNVGGIPAMFISTADGDAFEASPTGNSVVIDPAVLTFNPWGFVRIYDTTDPTAPVLLSTFHTADSLNLIGPDTEVDGRIEPGVMVKVHGTQQADGSIVAREIDVLAPGAAVEDRLPGQLELEGEELEFEGEVVAVAGGTLSVTTTAGTFTVVIGLDTEVDGRIESGVMVKVHGTQQDDGSIVAREIDVLGPEAAVEDRVPGELELEGEELEFEGQVVTVEDGTLTVTTTAGTFTVVIVLDTEVDGRIESGVLVKVHGTQQADGSIVAREIDVLAPEAVVEDRVPGDLELEGEELEFEGQVMAVAGGTLSVTTAAGTFTVVIGLDTEVDGQIEPGVLVKVHGTQQADGSIVAREIDVLVPGVDEDRRGENGGDGGGGEDDGDDHSGPGGSNSGPGSGDEAG